MQIKIENNLIYRVVNANTTVSTGIAYDEAERLTGAGLLKISWSFILHKLEVRFIVFAERILCAAHRAVRGKTDFDRSRLGWVMQIFSDKKWISKLLLLCLLLPAEIGAASPKHALGLQLGGAYVQNRDALGSPFRYGGGVNAFGLMYRYRGVSEHMARIDIAFGSLTPRSKTFEKSADYYFGTVQYGYFRPWSRFRVKWGGIWNAVFAARAYQYRPNANDGSVVYHFFSSLNAAVLYERAFFDRDRFYVKAHVPLLVYITRSPYALIDERFGRALIEEESLVLAMLKGGEVTSLHRFVNANFVLGYERPLGRRLALDVRYRGTYYRYAHPVKTATLAQRVALGLTFAF